MALARWSLSTISNRSFVSVSDRHVEIHSIVPENLVTMLRAVVSNEGRELNAYRIQKFNPDGFVDSLVPSCIVHARKTGFVLDCRISTELFMEQANPRILTINFQSGLPGISETSSDMRDLLNRESKDVRAAEAVALFCYQIKKCIGAFAAALGGLDTLVFAGGIGENAPTVRARICEGLGFLGIELEKKQNAANEGVISTASSRVAVRVIRTDEERMIAKTVCCVLGLGSKRRTKS
jgi:hypothetical protein